MTLEEFRANCHDRHGGAKSFRAITSRGWKYCCSTDNSKWQWQKVLRNGHIEIEGGNQWLQDTEAAWKSVFSSKI